MPTAELNVPVLVVGAGPVGAALALKLAHHGVSSLVVDRAKAASRHPKMDFLNARTMEHYGRLGLAEQIRAAGVPASQLFNFQWTEGLDQPPLSVWEYPSVAEIRARMARTNDGSMPREAYQRVIGSRLEELGRRRLRASGLVDLREGYGLEEFTQDADGVTARISALDGREPLRVRARYLVGCDGANSTVRRIAGIDAPNVGPAVEHRDVFFRSTDPRLRRYGQFFLTIASRGLVLVSRDGEQLWTGTFPLFSDHDRDADPVTVVQQRLGVDIDIDEVLVVAHWEGKLAVAEEYRRGSVFLAGDAAHQFFPTGGHGANTGLGDAVDLGWKLAATVDGWAGNQLLDSYQAERRPVALFNREMCGNLLDVWRRYPTLAANGATRAQLAGFLDHERHQIDNIGIHLGYRYNSSPIIQHEEGPEPPWDWHRIAVTTWPGGRLPSVRLANGTELHDLLGPGFTLLDGSNSQAGKRFIDEAVRLGVPLSYLPIDDPHVRDVLERDLVLVRPDQHVAWRDDQLPAVPASVFELVLGH